MKKLFAILLTLLVILALPVTALAREADTATADTTAADTATVGGVDTAELETSVESETETPDTQALSFGFFPETLSQTLPIMGMGMLGIFLVTCVIILAVLILSKIGKKSED